MSKAAEQLIGIIMQNQGKYDRDHSFDALVLLPPRRTQYYPRKKLSDHRSKHAFWRKSLQTRGQISSSFGMLIMLHLTNRWHLMIMEHGLPFINFNQTITLVSLLVKIS